LTSKRFAELQLSKNFQPMTLAEMKAIEPIAFEKAGIDWDKAGTAPKPIDLRYTAPAGKSVPVVEPEPEISGPFGTVATFWEKIDNIEKTKRVLKEKFNIKEVISYDEKVTDQVKNLNIIGKTLAEDIYAKFPKLAETMKSNLKRSRLQGLFIDKTLTPKGARSKGVLANYWNTSKHIRLGQNSLFRTTPNLKLGDSNVSLDFASTFRHEYGHHLHVSGIKPSDKKRWDQFFEKGYYGKYKGQEIVDFYSDVSQYSVTNNREGFAETFSAITSPKYDWKGEYGTKYRLPKALEDFMISIIGEPKGGRT